MMRASTILKTLGVAGVASALLLGLGTPADAAERVKWKMQSTFGSTLTHLGPAALRFVKDVETMSGGTLQIKFFEPNALIPSLECFDTVAKGSIDSCWTTPGYHAGKVPARWRWASPSWAPSWRP